MDENCCDWNLRNFPIKHDQIELKLSQSEKLKGITLTFVKFILKYFYYLICLGLLLKFQI